MATRSKAPIWQRLISALLAFGATWAFAARALSGDLDTWPEVGVMLAALYGGYLFGHFALRGQLPGVLAGRRGLQPHDTGDAGDAGQFNQDPASRGPASGVGHCMSVFRGSTFKADRAWGAVEIANMGGVTTRLHWTDQPYKWHINDGEEVFAVLAGRVEMRFLDETGCEQRTLLESGDVFYAAIGTEHVAHPVGEARVLVVEREGSV